MKIIGNITKENIIAKGSQILSVIRYLTKGAIVDDTVYTVDDPILTVDDVTFTTGDVNVVASSTRQNMSVSNKNNKLRVNIISDNIKGG